MAAKVGKIAATLVFFLVVEAQRRVNVNVHINITNSGSGSATGHIEGPNQAPLQLRPTGEIRPGRSRRRMSQEEDCRQFHFGECSEITESNTDTVLKDVRDKSDCQDACYKNLFIEGCNSWLWHFSRSTGKFQCWNSQRSVELLVSVQCHVFYGRVGTNEEDYDTCVDGTTDQCRTGECSPLNFGEELPNHLRRHVLANTELECKKACHIADGCYSYSWDRPSKFCTMFKQGSTSVPTTMSCTLQAGKTKAEECSKVCLRKMELAVSGRSSVYKDNESRWGADGALTEPTDGDCDSGSCWISAKNDATPWISFKLPGATVNVGVVKVSGRKDGSMERYVDVEVKVGSSMTEVNDRISCGTQSYTDHTDYVYECPEGASGQYIFVQKHGPIEGVENFLAVDYVEVEARCFCDNTDTCVYM